jgi:Protein of unknown function (DUF1625).
MAYQETTKKSYGQQLSGSFKGILSGLIMLIVGTGVLFWNEGNFVKTKKSINEAQGVVIVVDNVASIDPELNGKLIHSVAKVQTTDILSDELFDVSVTAVKLSRKVEYYQWVETSKSETKDKIGGGQETVTTYTYKKQWESSPVNSANFHDPEYQSANTTITTIEAKDKVADLVTWGAYELPVFIKNAVSGTAPAAIQLSEETKVQWRNVVKPTSTSSTSFFNIVETESVHVSNNTVFLGENPSSPEIGDVRVTITYTPPGSDLSIIAQVKDNTFAKYVAKNGKEFSSIKNGIASADQMFEGEHKSNSMWTWILRIVGLFLVIGALKSMLSILPTLFKILPFLGNVVGAGVGLVCSVLGFVWTLIVIAIAWLFYRPIIGVLLLVVAIAGIWFLKTKAKEKKALAK